MVDETYKTNIEQRIVDAIADALEAGKIQEKDLPPLSTYILAQMDRITTHDQLIGFLSHLSLRWPVFHHIAIEEEGKLKKVVETKVAQDMVRLINQGDTNQAVNLAESIKQSK
jgi:hypothetical protein